MNDVDRLAVIIPARNAAATLPRCLDALAEAAVAPSQVCVVDDASDDDTAAIATRFGAQVLNSQTARGAAVARNLGVAATTAPLVLFVDADVAVHPDCPAGMIAALDDLPDHAGVFGSYDDKPEAPGTLSRVRNLLHHHVHQMSGGDVPSFWAGCGAIQRADFEAAGGFEPGHPLEDVALGLTLARSGRKVRLRPDLQATHLKRWTLRSMVRADLLYRALPWSRLLLDPANGDIPPVLNAGGAGKVSVLLSGAAAGLLVISPLAPAALAGALLAVAALAIQNRAFLSLVRAKLGTVAALQAVGVLWVHFLCAGLGFALALGERLIRRQ